MAFIYGLFDPRKPLHLWEVRYVGMTSTTIEERLQGHLACRRCRPVCLWVAKLLSEGIEPVIRVLETTTDEDRGIRETAWIKDGRRQGWRLPNLNDGGEGQSLGFRFTDDQKARLSEIVKQRHVDDPGIADRKREGQNRRYSDPSQRQRIGSKVSATIAAKDQTDQFCPECGSGPFRGVHGLSAHIGNHGVMEPLMCDDCGSGPFDGKRGLGIHRGRWCSQRIQSAI